VLQLLFALLILSGVFLTILPKILGHEIAGSLFVFYIVYFLSTAPNAVSFCTKELVFRERKDVRVFFFPASRSAGLTVVISWTSLS
jgi:hypothetical protein